MDTPHTHSHNHPAERASSDRILTSEDYKQAFDRSPYGIIIFDGEGVAREMNRRACDILGRDKTDVDKVRLADLFSTEHEQSSIPLLNTLGQRESVTAQGSFRKKNGRAVYLDMGITVLREGLFACQVKDITEDRKSRLALAESEERHRTLVDAAPYPTAVFVRNKLAHSNRAFKDLFSWMDTSGTSELTLSDFLGKENAKLVREIRALTRESPPPAERFRGEASFDTPSGNRLDCEVTAVPVSLDGKGGFVCTCVDITERSRKARDVQESEEKYRHLVESSVDAMSLSQDDTFVFVNQGFLSMFGYSSPEEIIGKPAATILAPRERRQQSRKEPKKGKRVGGPTCGEYSGVRKDGTLIDVEVQESTFQLGRKTATLGVHRDVTLRKRKEKEVLEHARSRELLHEISSAVFQKLDLNEVIAAGLHSTLRALECEVGGLYRPLKPGAELTLVCHHGFTEKLLSVLSQQSAQEGVTGYVMKTLQPLVLSIDTYPPHLPYRSLFAAEGLTQVVYIPLLSGDVASAVLVFATRRKKVFGGHERYLIDSVGPVIGGAIENAMRHLALKESEALYRSSVEGVADTIYQAGATGAFLFISPTIRTLIGYSEDDLYRTPDLWRTLIHPDDRSLYSQRLMSDGEKLTVEYRVLPKGKASYRWVRDSVVYRRDAQGQLLSFTGLLSDMTEQRNSQATLAKSGELKTDIIESVGEGVVVYDADLVCLDWNSAMEHITGIARDVVIGQNAATNPLRIGLDELRPLIKQALQGATVSSEDIPLTLPGEIEPRYIWARYSPLLNREEKITGVVGIITDVTVRRRLEHEAKESEQILRNVIDGMGDALMICDLQGKVWEVNREFSRITGFTRSKVLGMDFPYPWLVDEEMARFVKWIAALREMNELRDFDMTWQREDGQRVAMSLNTTLLRNALGEPVAMLNIARDISDRIRLGLELEKKNSQIEMLNRIISKANATLDFNEMFDTIASEVHALTPYDQINVGLLSDDGTSMLVYACHSPIGKLTPAGTTVPIDNTVSKLAILQKKGVVVGRLSAHERLGPTTMSLEEGFEAQISIPISVNERVLGTFNILSEQPEAFSSEELAYLQPIADQIGAMIDRFRLFRRVSDHSTYIHNLLNSINSVVYTADTNHCITEVNKTWREFSLRLGLPRYQNESSIIGHSLWEIIPQPELRSGLEHAVPQLFGRQMEHYGQEYEVQWNGEHHTYHLAVSPMVINDKVTGLVFIHSDITEIKRTEAEIKRRNKELVAVNAISTSISKSLHLDEVLRVAADQIRDIVGAQLVLFYLRDERKNQLTLSHALGLPDKLVSRIAVLPAATSVSGMVIAERKPVIINHGVASDARVTSEGREVLGQLGIESLVAIPLQSKDRVLGAMDVAFLERPDLDVQEQQLLVLIGNQIGPAIENAVLYREVQEQVQRMTSLYMIGKQLTGTLDVKTLLEVVHNEVAHAIPVDQFLYQSYSAEQETFTTVFEASGDRSTYFGASVDPLREMNLRMAEYAGSIIRGHPWISESPSDRLTGGCQMAVPVKSKQQVVGVLVVSHSSPDAYTETHLRLLESIANLTEIALEKALLYEDTINKTLEIQNRNKELDDFTYVVSHDLKEPLISIEGYSKILLKDYQEKIDGEGREYLGSVVQSSARLKNLIEDLLTLSRVGRTAEEVRPVSVSETITEIIHDLQFTLREKNVEVVVQPGLPTVLYSATQLSMVFRNLISNAMKFNDKPRPKIAIGVRSLEDEFEFFVADNGIGIERQYFDRIFMIFQRLHRHEEFRGTGAGLTIVKKIVENHKGRIWVDSTMGQGTIFYFTVPRQPGQAMHADTGHEGS